MRGSLGQYLQCLLLHVRVVLGEFVAEVFEGVGTGLGGEESAGYIVVEVAWSWGGCGVSGAVEG